MRTRGALVVVAVAVALAACGSKKREKEAKPKFEESSFALPNGLQVDLAAGDCRDEVQVTVLFEVGTDHDPPGRSGMGDVVAELITGEAGRDFAVYAVTVTGGALLEEIDRVAARMAKLEITQEDLTRAKAKVLAELEKRRGGDAAMMAMSYAAEAVQPTRGNGWRGGVVTEIEAIDVAQVETFWQAHFKPANARLVVVGPFDPAEVKARVEAAFAPLSAGQPPILRDPAESTVTGTLVMGDAPTAVAIAVPAPAPSDVLYPAFMAQAARVPGATWDPLVEPETLFVIGSMSPGERPEAAAERIRAETATALARGLTPGDVAAARDEFGLLLATQACELNGRAFAIARARRAQLRLDATALAAALEAMTQEQLEQAAALFGPKRTAAVIAGGTIR